MKDNSTSRRTKTLNNRSYGYQTGVFCAGIGDGGTGGDWGGWIDCDEERILSSEDIIPLY